MTDESSAGRPGVPPRTFVEDLGIVPLLEVYFRRVQVDMPADLEKTFGEYGLTARHGAVLAQLAVVDALSVSELAQRMALSLPTVSELIGDLRKAGLVSSWQDPDNRRRTLVSLNEQRRTSIEALVAARSAPLLRVLESLSPRDREGFVAGLQAWAREVRNW
jgi:DNA-binding MarR family transcriptional regulator